jgi:hypothetical protein
LHPRLSLSPDGVSEFTFAGLYLFRNRYNYRVSRLGIDSGFIISGEQPVHSPLDVTNSEQQNIPMSKKTFFMTPCEAPNWDVLVSLFETHDYWKNISESVLSPVQKEFEERGIVFLEDRNNFDYLYYRKDLAELKGKKFHKKKNHVNNFLKTYPDYEQLQMNAALVPLAIEILDSWRQNAVLYNDGDYAAAREVLDLFSFFSLQGSLFLVGGKPAAYCLGESVARGRMFAIHFEKGIDEYKGIYQFVNKTFAASLPRFFTWINREQDLGDEGLRQSKMTYRPCDFVRKYTAPRLEKTNDVFNKLPQH